MKFYFKLLLGLFIACSFVIVAPVSSNTTLNFEVKELDTDVNQSLFANNTTTSSPLLTINAEPYEGYFTQGQVQSFYFSSFVPRNIAIYSECERYLGTIDNFDLRVDLYDLGSSVVPYVTPMFASYSTTAAIQNYYNPVLVKSDDDSGYNRQFYLRYSIQANTLYRFDVTVLSMPGIRLCAIFLTDDIFSYGDPKNYVMNHTLVKDGKVIYKINSKYESEILAAINKWNAFGKVQFVPKTLFTSATVTFEDGILDYNVWAVTNFTNKKVTFDKNKFQNASYNQRVFVALHEVGHVLGLDMDEVPEYQETFNNVMMSRYIREFTEIGPADLKAYYKKWG